MSDLYKSDHELRKQKAELRDEWPYRSYRREQDAEDRIREITLALRRREERREEEAAEKLRIARNADARRHDAERQQEYEQAQEQEQPDEQP